MADEQEERPRGAYSRREALAALAKYSAAVGGAAVTIVSADGLVSAASAYNPKACDNPGKNPQCAGTFSSSFVPPGRVKF